MYLRWRKMKKLIINAQDVQLFLSILKFLPLNKYNGFKFDSAERIYVKKDNKPTKTIKVIFVDKLNCKTFLKTGLKTDYLHYDVEPAKPNTQPVQCYKCCKFGHPAKYCKNVGICIKCSGPYAATLIEYKCKISTTFTMRGGTPQRSPLLYILFTSDSLSTIPSHNNLFADDTALWGIANTTKSLSIRLQESVTSL
ncbi:unnamed protein product [Didymodactylos carnosus]|uniref:CCHC-type domain-containing protein n=1 Tax=Didymodactylos carnosus TaxID=1234261 RepID=A0A813RG26_9BILA|nr:unnamed protein product [Didymodactylos carnosus]CAF0795203.1 unnamed protein product [Didymodactylos carnosus]CAF3564911.1 unnamed protein product [Didymodactylos carnosus]CAF3578158.1 unnamed protein product [Didymodactylos carnosus]